MAMARAKAIAAMTDQGKSASSYETIVRELTAGE